ncbi:MAG: DUF418 domain-containing protein [Chitinophagaceae bacterium]|nr:MAG: DUF418 domain-containing protein [Chitinophagaceae bacterium]
MTQIQPTAGSERHLLLDVLRGFALLGVLLANMASHSGYFFLSQTTQQAFTTATADHYSSWFEHFLIDGKFYSLFSLLFGIGFALQMQRSEKSGTKFLPRFLRRILIMFILGLLHAVLLFVGDILTVYAITALLLLLFRKASDKTLIRSAVILMVLPIIQYAILWVTNVPTPPPPAGSTSEPAFFETVINVYRNGNFGEIIQMNLGGLIMGRYPDLIFTGRFFRVLAMFLIGLYIARHMIYARVNEYRALIKKTMLWGAVIGIPCNIILAIMMTTDEYYNLTGKGFIEPVVYSFGVPALCLFYASAIALLFENDVWKKRLMIFAPVGQMALTNYIMQSVICVFIFAGYGMGLVASVGPAKLSLIAFVIYAAQMIINHIWLRYFRFGPLEWLWRTLTYGKAPKMKS